MTNGNSTTSVVPLADVPARMAAQWEELVDGLGLNLSLGPDWTTLTAHSQGVLDQCRVLMLHTGDDLNAVLPFTVSRRRRFGVALSVLMPIGNLVSNHNAMAARLPPAEIVALLVELAARERCDVIQIANVVDDYLSPDVFSSAAGVGYVDRWIGESSPYLPLDSNWEALLASKPKKFRYKVRKRAETLELSTDVQVRWYVTAEDSAPLLAAMQAIESNSWKHDEQVSIFGRPHERRYHELLLPFLGRRGALCANVLFVRSHPVAYGLCCHWNGWVGLLKTSFDRAHAEMSPGSILTDQSVCRAIERGAAEFDFLGDRDPYKLSWTKHVRAHSTYHLYLASSLKGRLLGAAKALRAKLARDPRRDGPSPAPATDAGDI